MGKTILVDESIQDYVSQLYDTGQWQLGLIIGQPTHHKDYAVRLICSPEPVEDEASEDDEEPKQAKKSQKPVSMVDCDERWIATHARQVTRMLPGGLHVMGIFALAPPNMMSSSQAKFRQILYLIHRGVSKGLIQKDLSTERYLLQICSNTRKFTCKIIDVLDPKNGFRPADWKSQSTKEKWIKLQTDINIDLKINVPVRQQNQSMLKQIQQGILPYCGNLCKGIMSINGELRDLTEVLDHSTTESKRSKGRDKGQTTQKVYNVDFYTEPISARLDEPEFHESICRLVIQGVTNGRAFVHSKSVVSEAKQAMITDIIRSIHSRCELLCEDIEVIEEEEKVKTGIKKELYDTPVRVFGKLPGSNLDFCDYKFQDEKLEEVIDRIEELLDIKMDPTELELDCEQVACEENLLESKDDILNTGNSKKNSKDSQKSIFNIFTVIAGGIAVLAAGLSYMIIGDSNT